MLCVCLAGRIATCHVTGHSRFCFTLLPTLVTGIPEGIGFIAVEQCLGLSHVTDVARHA